MKWISVALLVVISAPVSLAQAAERATWSNEGGTVASTDLIGAPVRNAEGENVGRIDALLVDPRSDRVSYAVVALAPLPTLTQRHVVVPWSEIRLQVEEERIRKATRTRIVARVEQRVLAAAPRYEQ